MDGEHRRMLKADVSEYTPNATVAKDGSGNFTTVSEALNAMPEKYTGRYMIYVKEGVYEENVIVTKKKNGRLPSYPIRRKHTDSSTVVVTSRERGLHLWRCSSRVPELHDLHKKAMDNQQTLSRLKAG
ncbi:hypothetical protein RD792_010921 [Penstemon davidsonii]|uniref:Pectinesterase catalytic domain-containing protein n=1 Tax=Penstemon davidsonii TaxID=160366 RepID=A0ABR0D3X5_9LAMI|nr:hypothetical protein RD792_010921 [Penstemon davidsonii]